MPRYNGKAVTERNPFTSQESAVIDANTADNPILDNNDPTKETAPDREHGDDFEVAGENLVELKKTTENDVIEEGEVLNKITEIDNIAEEGQKDADAVEALAAVSTEMYAVLADKGYFTNGEALVIRGTIDAIERTNPDLRTSEKQMPSMEDFKIPGLEYSNAQVSMEGIVDKLNMALAKASANITRLFKNGIGLANSITPLIDNQLKRATALKGTLNSARRDAGQKEVSGSFVAALAVEGSAPEANTVLKTLKYLEQCNAEILSPQATDEAKKLINQLQQTLRNGVDGETIKSPSVTLRILLVLTAAYGTATAGALGGLKLGAASGNPGVAVAAGGLGAVGGYIGGGVGAAILANNNMKKNVDKQIKIDGSVAPELFKLYPTIAKVNFASGSPQLDGRHSLPLFGNRIIKVTQYATQVDITAFMKVTPSLELAKSEKNATGKTMQSLNPSQQVEVVNGTERMLQNARNYYKDYAQRNKAAADISVKTAELILSVNKETSSLSQRAVQNAFYRTMNWYTRMFWNGIFADQNKLANYTRSTAKALLDLVEASSAGAQGGTPSQEAYSPANDFF